VLKIPGCLKGSSFLNEAFREHLRRRLQGEEQDIEVNGFTMEGIIDEAAAKQFEWSNKRTVDVTRNIKPQLIQVHGLKANVRKNFDQNHVKMTRFAPRTPGKSRRN
jgi:hypothetical protein